MSNTQLPADKKMPVDLLHFLYWMTGYHNEVGEEIRLADHKFCFCSEGEEPDPITCKGIIQLYFLQYPDKATEYASKLHTSNVEKLNLQMTIKGIEDQLTVERVKHNTALALLQKFIDRHEAGLLPDRFIYDEIKQFLDGK